jgi:hypothetical protein
MAVEPALEPIPNPFEEEYAIQSQAPVPPTPNMWLLQRSDRMVYAMSTEAIRSDWVGRVIDERFPLLQWLGGSEWSGVFLTELPEHGSRKAAIKLVLVDARDEEAQLAAWEAAAPLSHSHLMRLYATGRCQVDSVRLFYSVTDFAGENLSEILPERSLTPGEAREMLAPVLDALAYLHGKGLVHGRLKPSNIMVVDDRVKLTCDQLRIVGGSGRYFPAKNVYDSPQGVTEPVTPAADIWSLGITLIEALTQKPPVWNRSAHREPVIPESVLEPFNSIARDCLRLEPELRCTLDEIKARLEPAKAAPVPARTAPEPPKAAPKPAAPVSHPAVVVTAPAAVVPTPAGEIRKPGLGKLPLVALALTLLALLGGIAVLQLRSRSTEPSPSAGQQESAPANGAVSPQSAAPEAPIPSHGVVKGEVAQRVVPDVPQGARDTIRIPIQVVVRVKTNAKGAVSDAALDEEPASHYFGNMALQSARTWSFKPAYVDGRAVPSEWLLRFEFAPDDTQVAAEEVTP